MARWIVTDPDGVEQFERPTKIVKARRMARQGWLNQNPDVAPYVSLFFKTRRDGSEFLAVDDSSTAWDSGWKIERER